MPVNLRLNRLLNAAGSGKLALVLVAVLIIFSLVGVLVPQEGQLSVQDIVQWQRQHPLATAALKPWGFFAVFHSWPFMIVMGLLAVNTLTCTLVHLFQRSGLHGFSKLNGIVRVGFAVLHLSFIGLLAGGSISAAFRMDGYILLTEGQSFADHPENYLRYSTGPLRAKGRRDFAVLLKEVEAAFEGADYLVDLQAVLQFQSQQNQLTEETVRINEPVDYDRMTFTLDETGYSPRLVLYKAGQESPLLNSFIAMKTFSTQEGRRYRDYLKLPFFERRIDFEFHPAGIQDRQTGGVLLEPEIAFEFEDSSIGTSGNPKVMLGQKVVVDEYEFEFTELRRWASFRVSNDPGYPIVCVALWLGLFALLLRYLPDFKDWRATPLPEDNE